MTRILLPVLIVIVALLGLVTIIPIFIRVLVYPRRRPREIDKWLDDLPGSEWDR